MCEQATLETIQEVVEEWTDDDRLFTVFEVSLEVKKRAASKGDPVERHNDMKNTTHRELERYINGGLYHKQLQDVGAPTKAFVYYPDGADPASYHPLNRRDQPKSAPTASSSSLPPVSAPSPAAPVAASSTNDDDTGDQLDVGRKPDARGTVAVPCYLIKQAGFLHRDTAYVYADQENGTPVLAVAKTVPSGFSPLTTYTVDENCNVRITRPTLQSADVGDGTYDFEYDSGANRVVVKKH